MSKKIEGCHGEKVSKKEIKKRLKKIKKESFNFLKLCGCTKKDIRKLKKGEDLPDFKDVDKLEKICRDALGDEIFELM